jgi:hypothetical protein
MSTQAEIRTIVIALVADDAGKLVNPTSYDVAITSALSIFSKHKPLLITESITGNATHDYSLPSVWKDEFSYIQNIEYPVAEVPPVYLGEGSYIIYDNGTLKKLRLLEYSPAATETFLVTYSALRAITQIPDSDVQAFSFLSASICCEMLSAIYSNYNDSSISADGINQRDKPNTYRELAKSYKKIYMSLIGISETKTTTPFMSVTSTQLGYQGGVDRLTHRRAVWQNK